MKHGMSYEEMIKYVCWELGEHKGRVREECRRMGVSYHTATSIQYGRIVNPGARTLERMADYFLAKRGWQGPEWKHGQYAKAVRDAISETDLQQQAGERKDDPGN